MITSMTSAMPVATKNNTVRAAGGRLAPRLKNPPEFSAYVSRTVSAKYDRPGIPASIVVAACFVTRSQPIVAKAATINTRRPIILEVVPLNDPACLKSVIA
jgi:hypothetical protein